MNLPHTQLCSIIPVIRSRNFYIRLYLGVDNTLPIFSLSWTATPSLLGVTATLNEGPVVSLRGQYWVQSSLSSSVTSTVGLCTPSASLQMTTGCVMQLMYSRERSHSKRPRQALAVGPRKREDSGETRMAFQYLKVGLWERREQTLQQSLLWQDKDKWF